jgi:hypothetical protein
MAPMAPMLSLLTSLVVMGVDPLSMGDLDILLGEAAAAELGGDEGEDLNIPAPPPVLVGLLDGLDGVGVNRVPLSRA